MRSANMSQYKYRIGTRMQIESLLIVLTAPVENVVSPGS